MLAIPFLLLSPASYISANIDRLTKILITASKYSEGGQQQDSPLRRAGLCGACMYAISPGSMLVVTEGRNLSLGFRCNFITFVLA